MRFLRLKPRRSSPEAARVGASAEEEEEQGRQGLLHRPLTSTDDCNVERSSVELPKMNVHHHHAPASTNMLEQPAVCPTQVVTLKAFIHCQGCARRAKKALAKLQGVSTFHVDADQQKVTVIGSVCANEVLECMNKVLKGTQLWDMPKNSPNPQSNVGS